MTMTSRRSVLFGLLSVAAGLSCRKHQAAEPRCKNCGMKIDPASAWRAEIEAGDGSTLEFDTPRCAFQAWRAGDTKSAPRVLRVQEYYDRVFRDAKEVRFIVGGDVTGPMGPDLVPVDPSRATKFIQDHNADRAYSFDEVTPAVLSALK